MQERQLELSKLLLRHRNAHFGVGILAFIGSSATGCYSSIRVTLVLALDESLEYGSHTIVDETVQTFVHSTATARRRGSRVQAG